MVNSTRKRSILANPFYVALMVVSTIFVLTTLGYLVSPYVLEASRVPQGASSRAFAAWLDHHAPVALGFEFVAMLVTGILAMLTEDWFVALRESTRTPSPGESARVPEQ
jgi:hypothetical protein